MSEDFKGKIAFLRAVIFLTLSFLIIIGNLFVLSALKNVKKIKRTTKMFMFSLAMADLFVGAILIPLRLNEVFYTEWTRTVTWCQLSISVNIFNLSASAMNLIIMMMDRLIYLRNPLHYHQIVTPRRSAIVISMLWICVLLFSIVPIFSGLAITESAHKNQNDYLCKYATILRDEYLTCMCIGDIIPLVVFGLVYVEILRIARKQMDELKALARSAHSFVQVKHLKQRERRSTRMILCLIVVFYFCWIPAIVAEILSINHGELVTQSFIMVISTLVYSNSFINCIVYYVCNDEFRKHFRKLLHIKDKPASNLKTRHRTLSKIRRQLSGVAPEPPILFTLDIVVTPEGDITNRRGVIEGQFQCTHF